MEKILQIGEGNFLRAFAEYFIQKAKNNGEDISVAITQPRTNTKVINTLKAQCCEYSIYLKGRMNGAVVDDTFKIDCVSRAIDGVGESDDLEALFVSNDLEVVISNTTEAGICFDKNNDATFPARLTRLLYKRYQNNSKPLVFLPVELIEDNGTELKRCITAYAELFGYDFAEYINSCYFCNTLVDRIVTGHIDGDADPCSVACEPYASWIIEADRNARNVLDFTKYSDEIVFCDDLRPYRERKVKILNGTHTMSVLGAYLCGITIVRDMMNNELFSRYIDKGLEEIKSTINMPKSELDAFADSVKERFNNPFIDHKLLDISLNSVSKFKARCLPSIVDYYNNTNQLPEILTFSLALLIAFYKQSDVVRDSDDMLALMSGDADDILSSDVWSVDMSFLKGRTLEFYNNIINNGVLTAVKEVIYE